MTTPTAGSTPAPPDALRAALAGRYTIERELGRGGMATVYLARDERHGRAVAIKVLRAELTDLLGRERFSREIETVARLQHPHIVPLFDSGSAAGFLYYVMPAVEGETLRQRLDRETHLPLADVLSITRELADALHYAHTQGLVHRDVKPENIHLSGGHALIADFGIARMISAAGGENITASGLAIGTPAYMSPEQAGGSEKVDARSDVYALGCVVYEMLAGEPPFTGRTAQAVIARHLQERPPSLRVVRPTVGLGVQEAIERALAKVPADRFAIATELSAALVRGSERRWWTMPRVAAAAAALLVVAAAVWQFGPTNSDSPPPDPRRIAVLYFTDRAGTLRVVADGLTEDLAQALASVEVLQVASLDQVRALRGASPDSVRRALGVGTVVEGNVEPVGDRVRVGVRLVDAANGTILANPTFERPLQGVLELRDQMVDEIARALRRALGEEVLLRQRQAETRDPEAWLALQRAEGLVRYGSELSNAGDAQGSRRAFDEADSLAARAERLDPRWVAPTVQRGWLAWSRAVVIASEGGAVDTWVQTALRYAQRAVTRSDGDPRALELRGFLRFASWRQAQGRSDADTLLRGAEQDLRAAVRTDPAQARSWYTLSEVLSARGELTEAEAAARKALQTDAYLAAARPALVRMYWTTLQRGALDEADRWCREGQARFADDPNFVECRLTLLGWGGHTAADVREAWRESERADADERLTAGAPHRRMLVAAVLARGGRGDSARAVIREIHRRYPTADFAVQEAAVLVLLDERPAALALLATLLREQPQYADFVRTHYLFRSLQNDSVFQALTQPAARP